MKSPNISLLFGHWTVLNSAKKEGEKGKAKLLASHKSPKNNVFSYGPTNLLNPIYTCVVQVGREIRHHGTHAKVKIFI